ncbi:MAG: extracellular solute-binding protein [Planctomycetes bacterium]|nr:extracellular solute-binding protein [Planctomycetota bacterium]
MPRLIIAHLLLVALCCAQERKVVVYVSLDEEHARVILEEFERTSGIKVLPLFDTEDNKTVGMVGRIIAEKASPVADVYWNNECAQTVRLKGLGLLQPYVSPNAQGIPAYYKDPDGTWTGFAARARVLVWNKTMISEAELPKRFLDFADPKFRGKIAMAKPLTGTTLTNAGILYARYGAAPTEELFKSFIANGVRFERGNGQVARLVSEGVVACGLTDTDDVSVKQREGHPVGMSFLDQADEGAIVIPNSVMILKGAPHLAEATALVDALLSPATESKLAKGASAQIPLHPGVEGPAGVPMGFRTMTVDFAAAAKAIDTHKMDLERMFGGAAPTTTDTESGSNSTILYMAIGALLLALAFLWMGFRRRPETV